MDIFNENKPEDYDSRTDVIKQDFKEHHVARSNIGAIVENFWHCIVGIGTSDSTSKV